MTTLGSKVWDMLHLIRHGGPALCNIAITNSCNATCDFCNFANGKVGRKDLRWIDAARSEEHTSELQSRLHLVCRLLLEKKKKKHRLVCIMNTEYISTRYNHVNT